MACFGKKASRSKYSIILLQDTPDGHEYFIATFQVLFLVLST